VDIVTHGLASLAVARGFYPRVGKTATACAVLAGIAANVDSLSHYFGPSAYLGWHKSFLHSILGGVVVSLIIPLIVVAAVLWGGLGIDVAVSKGSGAEGDLAGAHHPALLDLFLRLFFVSFSAALLHYGMEACQSIGVMVFWPFSRKRFAADWLPRIDPWILTILILTIAVPELLRLVSSEIGAKEKKPRGQTGAIIGLVMVLAYVSVRGTLHSNVLAVMNARTFHGETPRRVSAFPESLSLVTWNGIAETENALNEIEVNVMASSTFDPDTSQRLFKPQDSPALDAARNTAVAKRFLATARIPKATVEKSETGYGVTLRDFRYLSAGETQREVAALIELDSNNKVRSEELVWARDLPH
jgi:membrane-bound metal-dependent hydrolase YbcI (DUF457 family)